MILEEYLLESGAVKFGDFTLASGRKSSYYVDIKKASTNPGFLKETAVRMAQHVKDVDLIAGVELGAVPLAVALALEVGVPYIMVRKKPKSHGASNLIEGDMEKGDRVLFVEDVTTTGGSLIKGVKAVRDEGGVVTQCIVIVDRQEGATEALVPENIELIPLVKVSDLMD